MAGFVVDARLSPNSVPGLQLQRQWPVDGAVYAQVHEQPTTTVCCDTAQVSYVAEHR